MSVLPCIATFATGTYTVTRTDPRTLVMGRVQPPTTSTFPAEASVQPISGEELMRLPEGYRAENMRELWTTTELKVAGVGQEADKIDIDGKIYQVESVKKWDHDGVYYQAVVRLT